MKKTNQQSSAYEKYLEVKHEAIQDLLRERESLKQKLKDEAAKIKKLMAENAKKLAALDYTVKDTGVASGNERLPEPEIKKRLERFLAHEPHSIPEICLHLCIARSRFAKFMMNHPNFLKQEGGAKRTKKTKYSLNPRRTK